MHKNCLFGLVSAASIGGFLLFPLPSLAVDDCSPPFSSKTRPSVYLFDVKKQDKVTFNTSFNADDVANGANVSYTLSILPAFGKKRTPVFEKVETANAADGDFNTSSVSWNGKLSNGNNARNGRYLVKIKAKLKNREGFPKSATFESVTPFMLTSGGILSKLNSATAIPASGGNDPETNSHFSNFKYRYFYGNMHAHSNWSDGGIKVTSKKKGYGFPGGADPAQAYDYAKNKGGMHFLALVEHNHLMNDAFGDGATESNIKSRYLEGFDIADSASVDDAFVGLFGMEWGTISTGGHLNIYNCKKLISWNEEPHHKFAPKGGYLDVYTTVAENQEPDGTYVCFNHPDVKHFKSFKRTSDGDKVVRTLAVFSGPAFGKSESFKGEGENYETEYINALSRGWKIAPEAQHDNHYINYGTSTAARTVAMIPDGKKLNRKNLLQAFNERRIYASQDKNVQLRFATTGNEFVMGDEITAPYAMNLQAEVYDPDYEDIQAIEIWGGKVGRNASPASLIGSVDAEKKLEVTVNPEEAGEEWYYFTVVTQADGDKVYSAPIWITWQ